MIDPQSNKIMKKRNIAHGGVSEETWKRITGDPVKFFSPSVGRFFIEYFILLVVGLCCIFGVRWLLLAAKELLYTLCQ